MPKNEEKKIFVEMSDGLCLELTEELIDRLVADLPVPEALLMSVCQN